MKKLWSIILLLLLLTACGAQDSTSSPQGEETTQWSINEETLCDMIRVEFAKSNYRMEETPQYLLQLEEMMQLTVVSFTQSGDTVNAQIKVSAPDMYALAQELQSQPFESSEAADAMLCEAMKNAKTVQAELPLRFVCEDESWSCVLTEEFVDACYGGLFRFHNEYAQQNGGK